jgi:hypothetical protein
MTCFLFLAEESSFPNHSVIISVLLSSRPDYAHLEIMSNHVAVDHIPGSHPRLELTTSSRHGDFAE